MHAFAVTAAAATHVCAVEHKAHVQHALLEGGDVAGERRAAQRVGAASAAASAAAAAAAARRAPRHALRAFRHLGHQLLVAGHVRL